MPIEYLLLRELPESYEACPRCNAEPFKSFMRGIIQKNNRFGWRKKYCAVICSDCKHIIGYEDPTDKELKLKGVLYGTNV